MRELNSFYNSFLPRDQQVPLLSPRAHRELVTQATSTQDNYASLIQDQEHVLEGRPGPLPSGRPAASRAVITQRLAQVRELNSFYNSFLPRDQQVPLLSPRAR